MKRVLAILALVLASAAVTAAAQALAPGPDAATLAWMQAVLDNWERTCRRDLRTAVEPLPWMILYDDRYAWHVQPESGRLPPGAAVAASTLRYAGRSYRLTRLAHQDSRLWVPDRAALDLATVPTITMPYDSERKPVFVAALPALYRTRAGPEHAARLDELYFGSAAHELTHTRQIVDAARHIAALRATAALPASVDDNIVEREFAGNAEYKRAFEQEYRLLPTAVQAATDDEARRLVAALLDLVRARRARFFAGDTAGYARLEDIFLNMEGVAMWVQYRTSRERAPAGEDATATLLTLMQHGDSWSQQQGLALFLIIDRLVPGWQARVLSPGLPSPYDVLREAVEPRASGSPP